MTDLLASVQRIFDQIPHRRVALALQALLLVAGAMLLARISWLLVPVTPPPFAWQPMVVATGTASDDGLGEARDVALFGQLVAPTTTVVRPTVDAPKTTLSLKLTGIVASDEEGRGAAIIENKGKQATYGIGEQVDGTTATVRRVMRDRVILMNSGKEETLMLDGEEYRRADVGVAPVATTQSPRATTAATSQLQDMRRELRANPTAAMNHLSDYLRVSPVRDGEGLQGWRVNPGRDPQVFSAVGLKPNDLVIAMNGTDLTNLQQAMGVINQLGQMDEVALTVLRDGQQYEVNFALPQDGGSDANAGNDPDVAPAYGPDPDSVNEPPSDTAAEDPYIDAPSTDEMSPEPVE